MRTRRLFPFAPALAVLLLLAAGLVLAAQERAPAGNVASAFTYQGYLEQGGGPANGSFDFEFRLYDALAGCCQVGGVDAHSGVDVIDGIFTIQLDFGADAFDGAARWLQICVAPAGNSCTDLSPRQPLTAAPYAHSLRPGAVISGSVPIDTGALTLSSSAHGLTVSAAGQDGLRVDQTGGNGLYVGSAQFNGVDVAGDDLAGYFSGDIEITGSCTGCVLANFAMNAGDRPLQVGDVVSLRGVQPSGVDATPLLLLVGSADGSAAAVGVVIGGAERTQAADPRAGESAERLVPREADSVSPGGYLTIAFSGIVQVRVSALDGPIALGDRLAAGPDGPARPLQSRLVDGMRVSEGAPLVGIALEAVDAGREALIWLLVDLQ